MFKIDMDNQASCAGVMPDYIKEVKIREIIINRRK